jgi:hypothetical protein
MADTTSTTPEQPTPQRPATQVPSQGQQAAQRTLDRILGR